MVKIHRAVAGLSLLIASLAATLFTPAAAATEELLASSNDPGGDVRIRPGSKLTQGEKRSVDIRKVKLRRAGVKAQVVVTVREILLTPKFDQMFFVTFTEAVDAPDGQWITEAGFTSKGRLSYSTYHSADWSKYDNCDRVEVDVRRAKRQVIATIPWDCTPMDPVRVSIVTMTGTFRSDAPSYSIDRHSIRGYHDFTP